MALVSLLFSTCQTPTAGGSRDAATIVRFTGTGVTPREVTVNLNTRVVFLNEDSRRHQPASDPHPDHSLCPALNVGPIEPGDRVESGVLTTAKDCLFHDELNRADDRYTGRVLVGLQ
jgi:hypothetical protein